MARCLRAAAVAGAIVAAAVCPAVATAQVGAADARDIALDYVRDNAGDLGTTRADVAELAVMSSYRSSHNRVTHVTVNQRHRGLEVFGALATVNVAADGRVIFAGGSLVRGVKGGADSARLDPPGAVRSAANGLGLREPRDLRVLRRTAREDRGVGWRHLGGSDPGAARLPADRRRAPARVARHDRRRSGRAPLERDRRRRDREAAGQGRLDRPRQPRPARRARRARRRGDGLRTAVPGRRRLELPGARLPDREPERRAAGAARDAGRQRGVAVRLASTPTRRRGRSTRSRAATTRTRTSTRTTTRRPTSAATSTAGRGSTSTSRPT